MLFFARDHSRRSRWFLAGAAITLIAVGVWLWSGSEQSISEAKRQTVSASNATSTDEEVLLVDAGRVEVPDVPTSDEQAVPQEPSNDDEPPERPVPVVNGPVPGANNGAQRLSRTYHPSTPKEREYFINTILQSSHEKTSLRFTQDFYPDQMARLREDLTEAERQEALACLDEFVRSELNCALLVDDAVVEYVRTAPDLSQEYRQRLSRGGRPGKGGMIVTGLDPEGSDIWPAGYRELAVYYFLPFDEHEAIAEAAKRARESELKFEKYCRRRGGR